MDRNDLFIACLVLVIAMGFVGVCLSSVDISHSDKVFFGIVLPAIFVVGSVFMLKDAFKNLRLGFSKNINDVVGDGRMRVLVNYEENDVNKSALITCNGKDGSAQLFQISEEQKANLIFEGQKWQKHALFSVINDPSSGEIIIRVHEILASYTK